MSKGLEIKKALYEYNDKYDKKKKIGEVARKVYPDLTNPNSKVTGVINGDVKVNREEVVLFCKQLKCTPNKLFGYGKE